MSENIKYPVLESYPPDKQVSVVDLQDQGFREDTGAVIMRHESDAGILYILIRDDVKGRSWLPVRIA
jgi:hypothetical protein